MDQSAARIGILTVSDRASRGVYEDRGGPAIREYLDEVLSSPWEPVTRVVPDERAAIEDTLEELCEQEGCCLVVTTGGTGPAERDVTPEATEAVCEKMMPGFGELMRKVSLDKVPTAILSRQVENARARSASTPSGKSISSWRRMASRACAPPSRGGAASRASSRDGRGGEL